MSAKNYKPTIGLEIHAELKTRTKMFCDSKNDPDETKPNVNVCPICMGHPGTLPVINKEAVRHVIRVGVAVGGKIADFTEFDRKNYFYPDIPKGYQISQYKFPLVSGGELNGVLLTRVHLEEDTASSTHDTGDSASSADKFSLVDFNRAGVPLMELVTEPVIHSAEQAGNFARELQLLLRYLGVSDANMEKGEMRVEANISVSASKEFGTKVEVKNLNSFKAVERAIDYEVKRHIEILEKGEKISQETRGWDEDKGKTFSQRQKEDSHDYRYFPDPDLPKLKISEIPEFAEKTIKKGLPEPPWDKRKRYAKDFGLKDADIHIYVSNPGLAKHFESVADTLNLPAGEAGKKDLVALASNYIISNDAAKISADNLVKIILMIDKGELSSRGAKDVIEKLFEKDGDARKIAEENNLLQVSDTSALEKIAEKIISANQNVVADFKNGKAAAFQFLVGQGMKETKGSANPKVISDVLKKILDKK